MVLQVYSVLAGTSNW